MEAKHPTLKTVIAQLKNNDPSLTSLKLSKQGINDNDAKNLAEALTINTTLTSIKLGENYFTDQGAKALAKTLKKNTTITKFDLQSNNLGDKAANYFAEALTTNISLTHLDFFGNQIGDKGAISLAEALKYNTKLTYLDLSLNLISDEGIQYFVETLKINITLTELYFTHNNTTSVSEQALSDIEQCLQRNRENKQTTTNSSVTPLTQILPALHQNSATFFQGTAQSCSSNIQSQNNIERFVLTNPRSQFN